MERDEADPRKLEQIVKEYVPDRAIAQALTTAVEEWLTKRYVDVTEEPSEIRDLEELQNIYTNTPEYSNHAFVPRLLFTGMISNAIKALKSLYRHVKSAQDDALDCRNWAVRKQSLADAERQHRQSLEKIFDYVEGTTDEKLQRLLKDHEFLRRRVRLESW